MDDPSKTFWDDPKMYIDDPGLDTLLSLTTDELLLCQDPTMDELNEADEDVSPQKERHQTDKSNDGKHALQCAYPNCDKSYFKPSHLKVNAKSYFVSYPEMLFKFLSPRDIIIFASFQFKSMVKSILKINLQNNL